MMRLFESVMRLSSSSQGTTCSMKYFNRNATLVTSFEGLPGGTWSAEYAGNTIAVSQRRWGVLRSRDR